MEASPILTDSMLYEPPTTHYTPTELRPHPNIVLKAEGLKGRSTRVPKGRCSNQRQLQAKGHCRIVWRKIPSDFIRSQGKPYPDPVFAAIKQNTDNTTATKRTGHQEGQGSTLGRAVHPKGLFRPLYIPGLVVDIFDVEDSTPSIGVRCKVYIKAYEKEWRQRSLDTAIKVLWGAELWGNSYGAQWLYPRSPTFKWIFL